MNCRIAKRLHRIAATLLRSTPSSHTGWFFEHHRLGQRRSLNMAVRPEMRTIPKVAAWMLAASLFLPVTVLAKRIPAPVVEPVVHEGIRYTVPNDKGTVGYVVAWDVASGRQLWRKTIFRKWLCPCLEHDVQWVFIKQMRLDGERLLLVTERDKAYSLDLKTRRVKKLKEETRAQQGLNPDAARAGWQQCTGGGRCGPDGTRLIAWAEPPNARTPNRHERVWQPNPRASTSTSQP